ncbi:MAG TPA: VOC family protein [Pseudonocardiaceae bacterium]|nr:VOC family protein [Pseudonocardiaceae bacterium]
MSEMTDYRQGTPCWVDLATDDQPAAKDFYRTVFGWDYGDADVQRDSYTRAALRGKTVAGIFVPGRDGVPVVWTTYLATDDADVTAMAVTEHGGQLLTDVMDMDGRGRVLIGVDPTGGVFGVWEGPEDGAQGAELVNEPGALVWNELMSRDAPAARSFYTAVFGVRHSDPMSEDFDYTTIQVDGQNVGGIGAIGDTLPADVPSHWSVYFGVTDTDATVEAVRTAGGKVVGEPHDTPFGRQAVCVDPQGATFAVISLSAGPS